MPCSLCGGERCDCISSVLDAIQQPDPPEPAEALSARLRPPPARTPPATPAVAPWPPPAPPPPAWPSPGPAALWRGGAAGVRAGRRRYDLLATDHAISLVPAGFSAERLLFWLGFLMGIFPAILGGLIGAAVDRSHGGERLRQLAATPPRVLLSRPDVRVIAREQLAGGRAFSDQGTGGAALRLRDGEELQLRWTRQPHVSRLLQEVSGGLVTVGPRPLGQRALRVVGLLAAAIALLAVIGVALWAVAGTFETPDRPAPATVSPEERAAAIEQRSHEACRMAANAFEAPPERFGFELSNAEQAMQGAADLDRGYQPAADALRWFRDRAVNGMIEATEEEAAPHFGTLDRACAAHLANDEAPPGSF